MLTDKMKKAYEQHLALCEIYADSTKTMNFIPEINETERGIRFGFSFIIPPSSRDKLFKEKASKALKSLELDVVLKRLEPVEDAPAPRPSEPFVVTTFGSDRLGLVAGITEVMARFGVNITNLKAVFRGGDDPFSNIMIYEVDVPVDIERQAFRQALQERAEALGIDLSLQHRDVFEAIHRV